MPKDRPAVSLLEQVRANLPSKARRTWATSLPEDLRVELEAIRSDWQAGRLGDTTKTALGKAISVTLAARGIHCHSLTVTRWLAEH